jgi:glycosyltransferase involved in cell wall biosynthesis
MSVYNGERFLREAVDSILDQSFVDFEFVIIDDGSTDATWSIVSSYSDVRLRPIRNDHNLGLPRSLNRGLAVAQGDYIARMDGDDVALPRRLERQAALLDTHPEIGILGTDCHLIDIEGRQQGRLHMPISDLAIRWRSLLGNPFLHPTVMLRRQVLVSHGLTYDEGLETTQDYELWVRLLKHTRGANLGEPLLLYRLSDGVTATRRPEQLLNQDAIALRTIREQLPEVCLTPGEVSQLRALFIGGSPGPGSYDIGRVALLHRYLDMLARFEQRHKQDADWQALKREEAARLTRLLNRSPSPVGVFAVALRLIRLDPGILGRWAGSLLKGFGYFRLRRGARRLARRVAARWVAQ